MKFLFDFNLEEIKIIIQEGWRDLANTDFYQMKFSETELAFKVGVVLFFLILLKMVWILIGRWLGWENYSRKDSGHFISEKNERHFIARFLLAIPTLVLILPLLAVLFAIASPYFPTTKEEKKYIETRTRVELRDVSGSMGSGRFKNTKKSKAEVAMEAHLKFLEMRRGKNDRTAFWLFSDNPYPVQENFIVDDELYYLKVYDAPWELGSVNYNGTEDLWTTYPIPYDRYLYVPGQGGTQLSATLGVAIRIFDADAKKQKLSPYSNTGRAILIITDAAIADFDETKTDFEELSKRKIRPYIIFIDDSNGEDSENQLSNIPDLLKEVVSRGGKFFPVSDEDALNRAYQEIDKLEKTRVEIVKKSFKIPAFQKFIFMAIIALIIIIPVGLLTKLLNYP